MNFSTKFSFLSLLLIFSMATPSRAMEEASTRAPEVVLEAPAVNIEALVTGISEAAQFVQENKAKGFIQKVRNLPSNTQAYLKELYNNAQIKKACQEKGAQFFAFAQENAEKAIGILVTAIGTTYLVHRVSDKALKFTPMTDETKAKYSKWITTGEIIIGLSTAAALEYYGTGFNYILGKNKTLGYTGLALTLAIGLVYEMPYIRELLSKIPGKIKLIPALIAQIPSALKQISAKAQEIPGAIKRNKAKTAAGAGFGAGLVGLGIGLKRLGIKGIKDILNNKVMPTVSKYSSVATTFVTSHPRIAKSVVATAGVGALGAAAYKYGYKKLAKSKAPTEQELNANLNNPEYLYNALSNSTLEQNQIQIIRDQANNKLAEINDRLQKITLETARKHLTTVQASWNKVLDKVKP